MTTSKHLSSVALFPLCDARGVLTDALRDTSDSPATRGDALVFAWRLELPKGMNVGHAANAVLVSALSVPKSAWTRRQLLIIRELMMLAGRDEALPNMPRKILGGSTLSETNRRHRSRSVSRDSVEPRVDKRQADKREATPEEKVAKQDKEWWKLVGRTTSSVKSGQRKTRSERVSREP